MQMVQDGINRKIRILYIITRLVRGGADEHLLSTIYGSNNGYFESVLLVGGDTDFNMLKDVDKIKIHVIHELKRNVHPWYDMIALIKLTHFLRKNKFRIINTQTAKAGFIGRLAAKFAHQPIIIHTLHGITFHELMNPIIRNIYIIFERIVGHFTDRFLVVGEDLKRKYLAQHIGSPERYTTIHSGFEIDKFLRASIGICKFKAVFYKMLGISKKDIIIGMVSRLEPRKGFTYLLQAATRLVKLKPNLKFLIVGEGPSRNDLEDEVARLGIKDHVFFLGFRSDIPQIMAIMDIFVLTSLWEGLPRVLVQAALVGKPIVTFEVEGAWEVVKDNINGFIVPKKDIDLLVEKILFLIENYSVAQKMGDRGPDIVKDYWDVNVMVRRTKEVYYEFLENRITMN